MSARILVVGATGNVGSALVNELRGRNANVVAGTRQSATPSRAAGLNIPSISFDFEKPETMEEAFSGVDRAFLLLPLSEQMVAYGVAAVDAAKKAGLSFLVKSSELGADANSPRLALRAQGSIDQYLKESGVPWSILRPNFFMQNFAVHYLQAIRERGGISLPQGNGKVSFIDVRDIAAVAAEVLLAPRAHVGHTYDLTGPQALSNLEVARQLSAVAGRSLGYQALPDDVAIEAMSRRGVPKWIIEFVMSLHLHVREEQMAAVSSAVRDITGREPIQFERFALTYAAAWSRVQA